MDSAPRSDLSKVTIRSTLVGVVIVAAVFLITLIVLCINVFLKRTSIASPLNRAELITIWCMMIVTASLPTLGLASYLLPTLVGLTYFATPENGWIDLFHPYIPDWVAVKDRNAARYFYEGLPFGESIPWERWVRPVLFWLLFTMDIERPGLYSWV